MTLSFRVSEFLNPASSLVVPTSQLSVYGLGVSGLRLRE